MVISVYVDNDGRIIGINASDLSGCTDWVSCDAELLGLAVDDNLFDSDDNAVYRLVDGRAVMIGRDSA